MESKADLCQKLARLETSHDQLVGELSELDHLMRLVGFTYGIASLKETAIEMHRQGKSPSELDYLGG